MRTLLKSLSSLDGQPDDKGGDRFPGRSLKTLKFQSGQQLPFNTKHSVFDTQSKVHLLIVSITQVKAQIKTSYILNHTKHMNDIKHILPGYIFLIVMEKLKVFLGES